MVITLNINFYIVTSSEKPNFNYFHELQNEFVYNNNFFNLKITEFYSVMLTIIYYSINDNYLCIEKYL